MYALVKILVNPKETRVVHSNDIYNLSFGAGEDLVAASAFTPTSATDFKRKASYGILSGNGKECLFVWILGLAATEVQLEADKASRKITNSRRVSVGNEKVPAQVLHQVLALNAVEDGKAATAASVKAARTEEQLLLKKRHFQSKNGVDAEPKEKRKKEQQSITETSSGARASKSKDYPDIVEQPLSEDVASLVQPEQCPGTCPAARRLKAQLVSKELEIQKLKETVSTVQDENEKLKEGQQDHHNVVEVAKRVAQEMSLNLLNKLPSSAPSSSKACALIQAIPPIPLEDNCPNKEGHVHVGNGDFISEDDIIRGSVKVGLRKRLSFLVDQIWKGSVHTRYLSCGRTATDTTDDESWEKHPILDDHIQGICNILREYNWPRGFILEETAVRDCIRRYTSRKRDAYKISLLPPDEQEELKAKKRAQVKARRAKDKLENPKKKKLQGENKKQKKSAHVQRISSSAESESEDNAKGDKTPPAKTDDEEVETDDSN